MDIALLQSVDVCSSGQIEFRRKFGRTWHSLTEFEASFREHYDCWSWDEAVEKFSLDDEEWRKLREEIDSGVSLSRGLAIFDSLVAALTAAPGAPPACGQPQRQRVTSMGKAAYMVLIKPYVSVDYGPFRMSPAATVYVKDRGFFIDQGGLTQDWGKLWEMVEVDRHSVDIHAEIEAARAVGITLGIERAKQMMNHLSRCADCNREVCRCTVKG